MVQGLGIPTSTAGGPGPSPGWGTKIPQAKCYNQKKLKVLLRRCFSKQTNKRTNTWPPAVDKKKLKVFLKKVGKTTKPFRYDLNQIPYDYTVAVTNRFKGFDLIEHLKSYGRRFVTLYRRQ